MIKPLHPLFFFILNQQLLPPKEKKRPSIVDTTLFDRVLFMILHHVCFPHLESSWSGMGYFDPGSGRDSGLSGPE